MRPPFLEIGPALPPELPAATRLLADAGLPVEAIDSDQSLLLVARRGGQVLACTALDVQGEVLLLRSLVVVPARRGQGLGGRLLDEALRLATAAGLRSAASLARDAADLFALKGFRPLAPDRASAPLQGLLARPEDTSGHAPVMLRELHQGVRVRPAVEADMPAVLAIYNHEVTHSSSTYQVAPRTLQEQRDILQRRREEGHGFFVAEAPDGRVVGYSNYGPFRPREGWRFTGEHAVYLHPAWRGQGIGKLLLPPVMAHARRRGFHTLVGVIDAGNTASLRLHEALGFRVAGVLQEGGCKFERWLDVAFLQVML